MDFVREPLKLLVVSNLKPEKRTIKILKNRFLTFFLSLLVSHIFMSKLYEVRSIVKLI